MKVKSESEVAQSCLTLSGPMDCSLPGSSIHGIFQARVLEWGAIAFSQFCSQYSHIIPYNSALSPRLESPINARLLYALIFVVFLKLRRFTGLKNIWRMNELMKLHVCLLIDLLVSSLVFPQ